MESGETVTGLLCRLETEYLKKAERQFAAQMSTAAARSLNLYCAKNWAVGVRRPSCEFWCSIGANSRTCRRLGKRQLPGQCQEAHRLPTRHQSDLAPMRTRPGNCHRCRSSRSIRRFSSQLSSYFPVSFGLNVPATLP